MNAWLRRAGRGQLADGSWVVWSVSEGRRGRRWREVRYRSSHVITSLLLETDTNARFLHLEASTASGLITLHPEPDDTLHGNVVSPEAVEPVMGLSLGVDAIVLLEGSPISHAAAAFRLRQSTPDFNARSVRGLVIPLTLWLDPTVIRVERVGVSEWRFAGSEPFTIDDDGLPQLARSEIWPLEQE
jgi:hypothetical protein